MSGTNFVMKDNGEVNHGSMCINNCGFCSTEMINLKNTEPFEWTMNALMLGVGVGFDTLGENKIDIKQPAEINPWTKQKPTFVIPDSREGWVEALRWKLKAYFDGKAMPNFDYSLIRPYGSPIKGFGGVASGSKPLEELMDYIDNILQPLIGKKITVSAIVDIMNLIGRCVVAGNVRRCLPEYYEVLTEDGWKAITDVMIGEKVKVEGETFEIKNKFDSGKLEKLKINTPFGFQESSENHKWKVYDKEKDEIVWVITKNLIPERHFFLQEKENVNNNMKLENYNMIPITSVEHTGEIVQMYDIEVEKVHCFNARHPESKLATVSHNSAQVAIGNIDNDEYVNLKNPDINQEALYHHRWASNNSVYAYVGETDYNKIVEGITNNGEPGVFWIENAKKYSRMNNGPDYKDMKVKGLNPCVVGETLVLTQDGQMRMDELVSRYHNGEDILVWSMNTETHEWDWKHVVDGALTKTNTETITLTFEEDGEIKSLECTPNHEIWTNNRGYVEAQHLTEEDDIIFTK